MTEEQIQELLKKDWLDLVKEMKKIYPNGFDINKIDVRLKNELIKIRNPKMDIQKPIYERKNKKGT